VSRSWRLWSLGDAVEVAVGEQSLGQDREGDAPDSLSAEDVEQAVFDPAVEYIEYDG
jgi:hypothetical protein